MATIYKNLPANNQNFKHLFSISFAIFVLFGLMDLSKAFWIMIFNSTLTYGILYFVKGPWGPKLVFLFVLGHLSIKYVKVLKKVFQSFTIPNICTSTYVLQCKINV